MDYNKTICLLISIFFLGAILSNTVNAQSTTASSCNVNCNGDMLCEIQNLGNQVYCSFENGISQNAYSYIQEMSSNIYFELIGNLQFDGNSLNFYTQVQFLVESLLGLVLVFSAVKLIYSSTLDAIERQKAKTESQTTLVNMLLVAISMPIYLLAISLTNNISAFLTPSSTEFQNAINLSVVSGVIFLIIAIIVITLATFALFLRIILTFAGLFIFPFALLFESFSLTRSLGVGLKNLIITNFVVQIIDALMIKLMVLAIGSDTGMFFPTTSSLIIVCGILLFSVFVNFKLYSKAFEIGPSFKNGILLTGAVTGLAYRNNSNGKIKTENQSALEIDNRYV